MRTLRDLNRLRSETQPIALAAGFFDGLHRGHRKIIDRTLATAHAAGGQAWLLTFDVHPLRVLNPPLCGL